MVIQIVLITISIVILELVSTEIILLQYFNFLVILINLLYWFRRFNIAIICSFIAGILLDLIVQNPLGKTTFSLFIPILVTTLFDNIMQVESRVNRVAFSLISATFAIFISEVLFKLIFWDGEIVLVAIIKEMLYSGVLLLILHILLEKVLMKKEERSLLRKR